MAFDERAQFASQVTSDLHTIEQAIGDFYNLPSIGKTPTKINIGYPEDGQLERLIDRNYAISRCNGSYSFNYEDFEQFEKEVADILSPEVDCEVTSRRLFIGLGVAGTAVRELWDKPEVAPFKHAKYRDAVTEFFSSKDDIEEMIQGIFCDPEFLERAEMTKWLTDGRALSINGLRLRNRLLFDTTAMPEFVGVEYADLIQAARKVIPESYYNRDGELYSDILSIGLGQSPKGGDKLFFDALSDYTIATATPMRPESAKHLLSPAWSKD